MLVWLKRTHLSFGFQIYCALNDFLISTKIVNYFSIFQNILVPSAPYQLLILFIIWKSSKNDVLSLPVFFHIFHRTSVNMLFFWEKNLVFSPGKSFDPSINYSFRVSVWMFRLNQVWKHHLIWIVSIFNYKMSFNIFISKVFPIEHESRRYLSIDVGWLKLLFFKLNLLQDAIDNL